MPKNNIDLIKELLIEVSINKDKKDVLIRKINKIESELENHNLKYKDIAIKFIEDIKGDIEEGREINIDSTNNDEYVENFFKTKLETQNYNRLILEDSYKNIFNNIYSNNNLVFLENEFKKIENNFVNYYEKLKTDVIAQNLLIYTSFKRKNVHQALNRL
jgi:hypothetical protein